MCGGLNTEEVTVLVEITESEPEFSDGVLVVSSTARIWGQWRLMRSEVLRSGIEPCTCVIDARESCSPVGDWPWHALEKKPRCNAQSWFVMKMRI